MKKIILFLFVLLTHNYTYAQDTFSIVAVDKETGEIGAAGATCIKGIEQGTLTWLDEDMYNNLNTGILEQYLEEKNIQEGFEISHWSPSKILI